MSKAYAGNKVMRKADVILTAVIIFAALGAALMQTNFAGTYSKDARVEITLDGKPYGTYALSAPKTIEIDDAYDNVITIERGKDGRMYVRMKNADCPGQDCLRHTPISLGGQSIVCLPARLVAEIKRGGDGIDGYTY